MLAPRNLALAAVVRFAGAVANRGGFADRAAGDSAQPRLPRACGVAADAVDGARARFRTPARIPGWRYVLRDRVEIHGAAWHSGYAAFPMGAEAGSIFRCGPVSVVRACARSGRGPRQRCPTSALAAAAAGSRCGNGPGGRDCRPGAALVRSSHAVLLTSNLSAHARPAFSPGEEPSTVQDVYAALAGEKENQRLGALARQLRQLDVQLRFVPAEMFLRTAVEGYLESKQEQRL